MSRLRDIMHTLVGDRDFYTRDAFKLFSIALFGYEPTNFEIDLIYGNEQFLQYAMIINILKEKLRAIDNDNYLTFKCFRMLDKERKLIFFLV